MLHVFTGSDRRFDWYEDDGTSMAYPSGGFTRVPVIWDDAVGTLTIGARTGSYQGMPAKRAISVRFYGKDQATAPRLRREWREAGGV